MEPPKELPKELPNPDLPRPMPLPRGVLATESLFLSLMGPVGGGILSAALGGAVVESTETLGLAGV